MRRTVIAAAASVLFAASAQAQTATPAAAPPPPPQYGQPGVNLELAMKAVEAAAAEAKKNGWLTAIAVTTSGGHPRALQQDGPDPVRLDPDRNRQGQGRGHVPAADQNIRRSGQFRRSECLVASWRRASEGGLPLMRDGKVIGGIGCSGGTSQQDGVACKAGADTIK
jgi:uncharacterized protein GlcG (DUF336 family)